MSQKCFKVEYDLSYYGGDYSAVGDFACIPYEIVERLDLVLKAVRAKFDEEDVVQGAFRLVTGYDPQHIVSYNMDEAVDEEGEEWDD